MQNLLWAIIFPQETKWSWSPGELAQFFCAFFFGGLNLNRAILVLICQVFLFTSRLTFFVGCIDKSVKFFFSRHFPLFSHKFPRKWPGSSRGKTNTRMSPTCVPRLPFTLGLAAFSVGPLQSNHPIPLSYAPLTALCQIGCLWTRGKISAERWHGVLLGVRAVGLSREGCEGTSERNAVSSIPIRGGEWRGEGGGVTRE